MFGRDKFTKLPTSVYDFAYSLFFDRYCDQKSHSVMHCTSINICLVMHEILKDFKLRFPSFELVVTSLLIYMYIYGGLNQRLYQPVRL